MSIITYVNVAFTVINLAVALHCEIGSLGFGLNVFASAFNAVLAADAIMNAL